MNRLATLFLASLAIAGCGGDDPSDVQKVEVEYQISVGNIEVPSTISPNEPLPVRIYGFIGPNSCYRFDREETIEEEGLFDLTFFGIQDKSPGIQCLAVLIEWKGREFVKQPPHTNPVKVVVHQPNGETIEETVLVE